jgi:hypothetical protein
VGICAYSGFHLGPELAPRDRGVPREGRTYGAVGGSFLWSPQAATNRSQNFKILIFSGVRPPVVYGTCAVEVEAEPNSGSKRNPLYRLLIYYTLQYFNPTAPCVLLYRAVLCPQWGPRNAAVRAACYYSILYPTILKMLVYRYACSSHIHPAYCIIHNIPTSYIHV